MLRKVNRLRWTVVTMCVLLALGCDIRGDEDNTTVRIRHQRSYNRTAEDEREYQRNLNLIHDPKWRCEDPKPKLVYFNDAIGTVPVLPPDSQWLAYATVMHKCEPALGCCNYPKQCRPTRNQTVEVTFKQIHMGTGQASYYRIPYLNHTRCACLDT